MPAAAAEAERKLRERISYHAPWGVVHLDAQYSVIGVNQWVLDTFATSEAELLNRDITTLVHVEGAPIIDMLAATVPESDTMLPRVHIVSARHSGEFSILIRRSALTGAYSITIAPTANAATEATLMLAVQGFLSDVHEHVTLQSINESLQKRFHPMNIGVFCAMIQDANAVSRTLREQRTVEVFDFFGVWVFGKQIPMNRIADSQTMSRLLGVFSIDSKLMRFRDSFQTLLDPSIAASFTERYAMSGLNRLQSFSLYSKKEHIGHLSFMGPFVDVEVLKKLEILFHSIQSVFSQLHERALLETQVHRLQHLNTYITELSQINDLDTLYASIARAAHEIFDASHTFVLLREADDYAATVVAAVGATPDRECRFAWNVLPTEVARSMHTNIQQDMFLRTILDSTGLNAVLTVPLLQNGRCFAVLYIGNIHEELLSANDIIYARQFGEYVASYHSRLTLTQSLDASEKRYRFLLNESSNPVFVVDAEDRILHINHAGRRLVGVDDESTMLFTDFLTEQSVHRWDTERSRLRGRDIDKVFWNGEALNVLRQTKIPFEAEVICIQQDSAHLEYLITLQDITQRLRLEQQHRLRESELDLLARIAAVVNSSLDLDVLLERAFDILDEVGFGSMYGVLLLDDQQKPHLAAHRHIPSELLPVLIHDPNILRGGFELVLSSTEQPDYSSVFSLKSIYSNDMIAMFGNLIGAKISVDDQTIGAVLASRPFQGASDFTLREMQMLHAIANQLAQGITNARLHQSLQIAADRNSALYTEAETIRAHLSSVIESSPDALVLLRRQSWTMQVLNDDPFVGWGYTPGALQYQPLQIICPPDATALLDEHLARVRMHTAYSFEFRLLRANGTTFSALISSKVVNDTEILLSIKDITQMRLLEHRIKEREKLSLLGQMVASVAHELNNPIAVIRGIAQLQLLLPHSPELTKDFEVIERTSHRAARIVAQLRLLGQPQKIEFTEIDLAALVEHIVQQQQPVLRAAQVECSVTTPTTPCRVYGDSAQLEQVLVNLIDNAIRAIQPSQQLRMVKIDVAVHERTIDVRVADNGSGIPVQVRNRLFEPFFTTRPIGEGLGLGLAIVSAIVAQHHGTIRADDNAPRGTVFVLSLPSVVAPRLVVAKQTIASETYLTVVDVLREIITTPIVETDDPDTDADLFVIDATQLAAVPLEKLRRSSLCIIRTNQSPLPDLNDVNAIVCTPEMDTTLLRQQLAALTAPLQLR